MFSRASPRIITCIALSAAFHAVLLSTVGVYIKPVVGFKTYSLREQLMAHIELSAFKAAHFESPPYIPSADVLGALPESLVPLADFVQDTPDVLVGESEFLAIDLLDSPPRLLSGIELESEQDPDTAGYVINFRIEVTADGRAHRVEVTSNWLDEVTTAALIQQLQVARYQPGLRLGVPVPAVLLGGLGLEEEKKGPTKVGPEFDVK